jgi:UDP-N-acetylmuramate: L-alanyl-gamma-D-glutamyl-meso-diaminopimelate ligase
MLAWILEQTQADPSYLVGGLPRWNPRGFRLGRGPHLVIEGDEYNAAFFDRGPKFLHYRPHLFLIGPVEFDHADLYPDLEAVLTAFRAGAAQVPRYGAVVVNAWSEGAVAAVRDATAPVIRVGPHTDCQLRFLSWNAEGERSTAEIDWQGEKMLLDLPQAGIHNLQNATMAVAAAITTGTSPAAAAAAMKSFPGVVRRMEVVGEAAGVIVVDDFAHHPTALGVTIAAARQRWPKRRLVIAFEPRSLTAARRSFQESYLESLADADVVMVAPPFHRDRLEAAEVLDRETLSIALGDRGVESMMPGNDEDPVERLLDVLKPGDVVVGCSSGAFDAMHKKLIEALQTGDES